MLPPRNTHNRTTKPPNTAMFPYGNEIDMRRAILQRDNLLLQQQLRSSNTKTPRSDDEFAGLGNTPSKKMRWSASEERPNLSTFLSICFVATLCFVIMTLPDRFTHFTIFIDHFTRWLAARRIHGTFTFDAIVQNRFVANYGYSSPPIAHDSEQLYDGWIQPRQLVVFSVGAFALAESEPRLSGLEPNSTGHSSLSSREQHDSAKRSCVSYGGCPSQQCSTRTIKLYDFANSATGQN